MSSTLKKGNVETETTPKKDFSRKESYLTYLIEEKTSLVKGKHFDFADNTKAKKPRVIKIYAKPSGGIEKVKVLEMTKDFLETQPIELTGSSEDNTLSVDAKTIDVPDFFIRKLEAESVSAKKQEDTQPTGSSKNVSLDNNFSSNPIFLALEKNDALAFPKTLNENFVVLQMPDSTEKAYVKTLMDSFGFDSENCEVNCLKVFKNNLKNISDIVKIPGIEPTNSSRFKEDLAVATMITEWELKRQNNGVIFPDPKDGHMITPDATRSLPFRFSDSNTGRTKVESFASFMMQNYGVDIKPENDSPHIFRVLSPNDEEHAGSLGAQSKRERKQKGGIHPLSLQVKEWGYVISENHSGGKPFPRIHLDKFGNPSNIEIVHGTEEEKKALVDEIYTKIEDLPEYAKHLKDKGQKGTRVRFFYKTRKLSKSINPVTALLIKDGGFKTVDNKNKKVCGFRSQEKSDHTIFSAQGGSVSSKVELIEKIADFLSIKRFKPFFKEGSQYSFILYRNDPEYVKLLTGDGGVKKTNTKGSNEATVKEITPTGFEGRFISFLASELVENSDLHKKLRILFSGTNTKQAVRELLEKEFHAMSASFEGTAGKFYSAEDVQKLIGQVVAKLSD